MDNFFALPTQDLAIARDLQGRFQPPNPSFFTTTADSISESATPKQTVTQLDSPSPSPTAHSTPESATLKQTVTELHSASPSPTSVGVNGVQITDFSGLDVSLTFSRKLRWHQDPQGFLSMLTLRDPSSSLAYLDPRKVFCETVCLVRIEGLKSDSRLMWVEELS